MNPIQRSGATRPVLLLLCMLALVLRVAQATDVATTITHSASFFPSAIVVGDSAIFSWDARGGLYGDCTIDGVPGITFGGLSGSITVSPTTSLTATVYCEAGPSPDTVGTWTWSGTASLDVEPVPQPPTVSASFPGPSITRGNSTTLTWTSTFATDCSSQDVAGVSGPAGSVSVTPQVTQVDPPMSVTISCTGPAGQGSGTASLKVLPRGRPQVVIFPGTGGVRLEAADGSGPIWLDVDVLNVASGRDWNTFFQKLALASDPNSDDPRAVVPLSGPGARPVADGYIYDGLRGTGCLTNYTLGVCLGPYLGLSTNTNDGHLAGALEAAGIDYTIVNYDWRIGWENYYDAARQAFDQAYARGEGERIYVVGHSQGTQFARRFLLENPGYQSMVAANFAVGAPNLGSPAATTGNSPFTGGIDFGFGGFPFFMNKTNGLLLGGHAVTGYDQNPSKEFLRIVHYNTGRWLFEQFVYGTRTKPEADTPESAQLAMRSGAIAPALFDAGVRVQEEMAGSTTSIPTYQIVGKDLTQPATWRERQTRCPAGACIAQTVMDVGEIPSDGTIPSISSLGRFGGGQNMGTLALAPSEVPGESKHQHLVDASRTQSFIARAIFRDRGAADATFGSDFPLESDDEVLQRIGWQLPPPGAPLGAVRADLRAARTLTLAQPALAVANRVEITTRDVDAQLTIEISQPTTGAPVLLYQANKGGVARMNPNSQQIDHIELQLGDTPEPALMATSRTLFRSGFDADDTGVPVPVANGTSDLDTITVRVPLPSSDCKVRIFADRNIAATARVARQGIASAAWAKIAADVSLTPTVNLDYELLTGDSVGALSAESTAGTTPVQLVDDPDFVP